MQRLNRYYLLALFGTMLLAPFLNDRFHFVRFTRAGEHRRFHDSLSIDIGKLDKFPKDCELYLKDNFAFRTPMIRWGKSVKINLFNVSPDPGRLIIGKNGRYFVAGEERENYEGDHQWTTHQLDSFEGEWLRRKRYFDEKGISVYLLIAPTALEVYPEDLPAGITKRFGESRADQLRRHFRRHLPGLIVDPTPAFEAAKDSHNLYFRLDNHWNARAGQIVSELLTERLKKDRYPRLSTESGKNVRWRIRKTGDGYLAALMAQENLFEYIPVPVNTHELAREAPKYGFIPPTNFVYPNDYEFRFVNPKPKNKLKLLIVRDSFGDAVYPFLKESFAETVVIFDAWQYKVNKPVVEAYEPDVVIYITYDTHLKSYIDPKFWEQ